MKQLITAGALAAATLIVIEMMLFIFDPYGVLQFRRNLYIFYHDATTADGATDYALRPGLHLFEGWRMVVNPNGTRYTPGTNPNASRTLAFIGDSVTMGFGVNDNDVWVNLVARECSDWNIVNAGVSGYNSRNVIESMLAADAYIYYVVENDVETVTMPHPSNAWNSTIYRYLWFVYQKPRETTAQERARFWSDIATLAARGVYFVGDSDLMAQVAARYPSQSFMIERWSTTVSRADAHADVNGNREIAAQMIKIVKDIE